MIDQVWALSPGEKIDVKMRAGGYKYPVTIERHSDRLVFKFGYKKPLLDEIKESLEGRKYHGFDGAPLPRGKWWSCPLTDHNKFQLAYMLGSDPYEPYDAELVDFESSYPLYDHQKEMAAFVLTRRHCILAAEMGTGKTLTSIATLDKFLPENWTPADPHNQVWFVAPRSALRAVEREFRKWNSRITPEFMTYEGCKKRIENWVKGTPAPRCVIFDESSKLKNPKAQRTKAAQALADGIRSDWGRDSLIVLMSGSPAPKAPTDWYSQCKIACPGFLKEGNYYGFENRLALIVQKEGLEGVKYPERVCWRDDEKRCQVCGMEESHLNHDLIKYYDPHPFEKGSNEVARLYRRMQGLVDVKFKKDCLDLPEKLYEIIRVNPTKETLRLARLIQAGSSSAIQCLTKLRELSDGFQYVETPIGTVPCRGCAGKKKMLEWYDPENPESSVNPHDAALVEKFGSDDFEIWLKVQAEEFYFDPKELEERAHEIAKRFKQREVDCWNCQGTGEETEYRREAKEVNCPKIDALKNELELHEDYGRLVTFAGFFGSVDRVVRTVHECDWHTVRVDGRGWHVQTPAGEILSIDPLELFQDRLRDYPRVCFVGQPGAAGMGLTLTASPTIFYYSNDFNAESRIQSEDRIHRAGMDVNRGATIKDCFHLPSDQVVYDNLKKKRRLQSITLGEVQAMIEEAESGSRDV